MIWQASPVVCGWICLLYRRYRGWGFDPWVVKIPRRRTWQPTPVFLPEESQAQRSLVGYSSWDRTNWTWMSMHPLWSGFGLGWVYLGGVLVGFMSVVGFIHLSGGGWLTVSWGGGRNWAKCHSHSSRLPWTSSYGWWVPPVARESRLQCVRALQASAGDMLAYVPLAKASRRDNVRGQAQSYCVKVLQEDHGSREVWFNGGHYYNNNCYHF